MRTRAIEGAPGLDPVASPFEGLEQFARMIVRIHKVDADKEMRKPGATGNREARKKRSRRTQ